MRTDFQSVCGEKRGYDTKAIARAAARSTKAQPGVRGRLEPYACPYDHGGKTVWHVGHIALSELKRRNPRARRSAA